jgi:hypothetical protein
MGYYCSSGNRLLCAHRYLFRILWVSPCCCSMMHRLGTPMRIEIDGVREDLGHNYGWLEIFRRTFQMYGTYERFYCTWIILTHILVNSKETIWLSTVTRLSFFIIYASASAFTNLGWYRVRQISHLYSLVHLIFLSGKTSKTSIAFTNLGWYRVRQIY